MNGSFALSLADVLLIMHWMQNKYVCDCHKRLGNRMTCHLSPHLSTPAGCVRNTLHRSPPFPSLPVRRAETLGGVWRWCPTWRICTDTQRRRMMSSMMERMRSYTLRTSQCQVRGAPTPCVTILNISLKKCSKERKRFSVYRETRNSICSFTLKFFLRKKWLNL